MGKKINPTIYRLNTTATHLSKWFVSKQQFPQYLQQDVTIRRLLKNKLRDGGVSRIEIKRSSDQITLVIYTSKPGVIIGRSGSGIEEIKRTIKKGFFGSTKIKMNIEIEEVRRPDLDAALVMQNIINQLEKRVPFRRAMKRAIETVQQAGGKGVKVICSGRLNGVEIARTETLSHGSIPTHTLRADIDYARSAAQTIYGKIGVKVWIYRGQVFESKDAAKPVESRPMRNNNRNRNAAPRDSSRDNRGATGDAGKKSVRTYKRTIVKAQPKQPANVNAK
jgi:small subunit ribosomal protein S3